MKGAPRIVQFLPRNPVFAVFAVVLAIMPITSRSDPGPDIYKGNAPGVVRIQVAGVQATSSVNETGSGFIITRGGLVLTALHLLPKGVPLNELVVVGALGPDTSGAAATYVLEIVKPSSTVDAMLMRIVNPPSGLQPLPLRRSAPIPGEQLFVLGYPVDLPEVHILDGRVSSFTGSDITTNALINHGNSGGPVMDAAGCVIGLVYSGIESLAGQPVSGIKFALPLSAINELIPPEATTSSTASSAPALLIHVSDTLSVTQEEHPFFFSEYTAEHTSNIPARPGYIIENIEATDKVSLAPTRLTFPVPTIAADNKSLNFKFNLISGPFVDQWRGWVEMNVHTRQRYVGPSISVPSFSSRACT
jgi:hypothetical protein